TVFTVLDRTPLRIKLVAAILALVTVALLVIGAASVVTVRGYLIDKIDEQLRDVAGIAMTPATAQIKVVGVTLDFLQYTSTNGVGEARQVRRGLSPQDLPRLVTGVDRIEAVEGRPFTTVSPNGRVHWRMLVTVLPSGSVLHLGETMSTVDSGVH